MQVTDPDVRTPREIALSIRIRAASVYPRIRYQELATVTGYSLGYVKALLSEKQVQRAAADPRPALLKIEAAFPAVAAARSATAAAVLV